MKQKHYQFYARQDSNVTSKPHEKVSWGPLQALFGKWGGVRERRTIAGKVMRFYETRTFQRRSPVVDEPASQWVFPVLFLVRTFDFHERTKQINEETGYLIWIPGLGSISQITVDSVGMGRLEQGSMEECGITSCLIFGTSLESHSLLSANVVGKSTRVVSVESTFIFDSNTFRFDQNVEMIGSDRDDLSYRDIGDLVKIKP